MTGSTWYRCGLWVLLASHVMALGHLCLIQGPPTWDGGDHSFHAFQIHQALQRTDLDLFLAVTRSQTLWPFLHSWITGACLTLTGSSFITIRFVSLGFGLITLALSGFFAHRHRVASAPLTAFLLAGSPLFILYSIQPMLEIFGAAFTIAALGCAITGITTPDLRTRMRILTTTLVLLTFFIKYVYGILLILTLGLHCLHTFLHPGGGSHGSRRDAVLNAATWIAAPLLTAALWLMHPSQRTGFLACLHNPDSGFSILNPINWLIYPVTILLFYVSSPFLAIVLGLAGWRAYRRNRSPLLEISGLYILTTVILLTVYRYKLIRAPFTILPCLAIIGAGGLDDLIRDPPGKNRIRRLIALMLMGLLSIHGYVVLLPLSSLHLIPPWRHEMEYMVNLDPTLETALRTVGDRTNGTADLVICGEFNEVSSLQLSYFLCTSASEILRRVPSLFAWNQPVGSVQLIRMMDDRGYGRCLILSVEPGSMYDTADYREKFAWMSQNMVRPGSDASFTRTWILRFPNGLVAELWERSVKPEHHPVAIRPSGEQSGASGHMREEKPVKSVRLWT